MPSIGVSLAWEGEKTSSLCNKVNQPQPYIAKTKAASKCGMVLKEQTATITADTDMDSWQKTAIEAATEGAKMPSSSV